MRSALFGYYNVTDVVTNISVITSESSIFIKVVSNVEAAEVEPTVLKINENNLILLLNHIGAQQIIMTKNDGGRGDGGKQMGKIFHGELELR